MDWWFDNPIARMPGPLFLSVYSLWFIVWLLVARFISAFTNRNYSDPLPLPLPSQPDPFQVAYLRGGIPELLRTVLVDLLEKKRITRIEFKRHWYKIGHPTPMWAITDPQDLGLDLSHAHRIVINGLRGNACSMAELMQTLSRELRKQAETYKKPLQDQGLIISDQEAMQNGTNTFASVFFFATPGLYKIAAAFMHDHNNLLFLFGGVIFGTLCILGVSQRGSLTRRGRQYLKDLRIAFAPLKLTEQRNKHFDSSDNEIGGISATLMAMGIFGAIAIQDSEFHPLYQAFGNAALGSNSPYMNSGMFATGCGSGGCVSGGCGSGGCGSGGCGSGCGGGCGGCGGG